MITANPWWSFLRIWICVTIRRIVSLLVLLIIKCRDIVRGLLLLLMSILLHIRSYSSRIHLLYASTHWILWCLLGNSAIIASKIKLVATQLGLLLLILLLLWRLLFFPVFITVECHMIEIICSIICSPNLLLHLMSRRLRLHS